MRKYIFTLIIVVLIFDGLSNLRELTDLAIVKAIGIDYTEDETYKITAIVIDTTEKETAESGKIYQAEGESIQEAIRYIVDKAPRKLYLAHMETLILSEDIARKQMMDTLDFFIRDNEGSNNFYLFIANGCDAQTAINAINGQEINMKEMLISASKYRGNSNTKTLNDNIKDILRPGRDILVNSCKVEEGKIEISDMAFFDEWNMLGFLEDEESILCNLINNSMEDTIITSGENENLIVAEIISSKTKMTLQKDNSIMIKMKIKANISETGSNISIQNPKIVNNIEKILEEKINFETDTLIEKLKYEYNSDLIGIGNLLYRKKSELFEDPEYLKNTNVIVETDITIVNQGGVIKRW